MPKESSQRVLIRPPDRADAAAFLAAVRRSRSLHYPWVSPPSTPEAFTRYLERACSDAYYGFLLIHSQTGDILGVINVSNVIRGSFQSAFLGYYGFLPHARQGFMHQGLQLVLAHAFRRLKLHRLEANIQPGNHRSIALVRTSGFVKEGFSRRYLKVCGRWRDHERWAVLAEDFLRAS